MTNRNDLQTAHSGIESLERETRALAEQNAILTARLEPPPPQAPKPTPTKAVHESSPLLTADVESDEPVATWPATALVAILALATAAAVMFAGNT